VIQWGMARKRKKANRFGGGGVHEAGWGEPKVFGQTLDEVLAHLYFCLSEWFAEMKVLAERDGVPVRQLLLRGMQEARRSGRVVNALDDTAYKLFGGGWRGQDLLRFFVMKCPHYREAFLRGEVPQQPWGLSAGATPREADGQASSAPQETRTGRGVALPSVTGNQTPDVKSKSKRRRKRKGRPPVKQDKKKLVEQLEILN